MENQEMQGPIRMSSDDEQLSQQQQCYTNSLAIRQEIQRFESVHPSIYAIYDLLELTDPLIAKQIRDHVVCIEDAFVNSQEWTLSRAVPELRLGICGSLNSGKSALVHRYLTGSYLEDESPEGGRFKKEVLVEGHSYMLLIRDEAGPPEMQYSCWLDAVLFVFSLENESSFDMIHNYYLKMTNYRKAPNIPIILVGTQDFISDSQPQVISDQRARRLAAELNRCSYFESCATYGFNVDKIFQEACHKMIQSRSHQNSSRSNQGFPTFNRGVGGYKQTKANYHSPESSSNLNINHHFPHQYNNQPSNLLPSRLENRTDPSNKGSNVDSCLSSGKEGPPTPGSIRKNNRRRSNLFPQLVPGRSKSNTRPNGEVGSGRAIPIRQGYLYKKSLKSLNKDWKKKYVILSGDGELVYHPTLHDYMEDVHAKHIPLRHTTVKVPGRKPRGSRTSMQGPPNLSNEFYGRLLIGEGKNNGVSNGGPGGEKMFPSTNPKENWSKSGHKRHRRPKSGSKKEDGEDSDGSEFVIVSLDNKQWHFEASSSEDREAWVAAIEEQILTSLRGMESDRSSKSGTSAGADKAMLQALRAVPGNDRCADCQAPNPDWASLNLGALICITCSGIHRNLGSHISKVRSLHLDDWPPAHMNVMMALGNDAVNSIWEANCPVNSKPSANSAGEEKEEWVRRKWERREFLRKLRHDNISSMGKELMEAVANDDVNGVYYLTAHITGDNFPNDHQFHPVHLAAARGNLAILQLLIWNNFSVKSGDGKGKTALFYAQDGEKKEIQSLLASFGCTSIEAGVHSGSRRTDLFPNIPVKASDVFEQLPASII